MPLTKIQSDVLLLLAAQRDPESYVAGATPLNRRAWRYSGDIDIFHDREERVASTALNDVSILKAAGYQVAWLRQLPLIYAAEVTLQNQGTRLEWVADSDFRFFPTMRDETFGYLLLNPLRLTRRGQPNLRLPSHVGRDGTNQSAGKRGAGGAVRENIPYSGPQHPSRPNVKE